MVFYFCRLLSTQGHNIATTKASVQTRARNTLKPLINAICALLFVLLGLASAQVFWLAYGYWTASNGSFTEGAGPTIAAQPSSKNTLAMPVHYADDIGNAHFFGRPLTQAPAANIEVIPESQLKVIIRGILSLADDDESIAILSVENAADKVFKVGAQLTTGYRIHKIVANGVMVDHNGRLEMIRLPRASLADITANNAAAGNHLATGLGQLRAQIMRNPLALEQHIKFVPFTNNGQFAGYRVNQGNKPDMFNKLGLQANDIVASVDGVGIGQLAGRMDILTNLSVAKSLRLGIIRNGQEQQLFVDFSQ